MARYNDIFEFDSNMEGKGLCIGVVMSRFNIDVSEGLLAACTAELARLGVRTMDTVIATVPGALEIPLALQKLAMSGKYHALIGLGAVIRGETYHFQLVAEESAGGMTSVQLDTGVPVANGVLTTDTDDQAEARMAVKGRDAARAAVEMANLLRAMTDRHR